MLTGHWKVLVLKFLEMESTIFFEPEVRWKYVYWLLKSSCFELFGDRKYDYFLAKKLIERLYLLGLFEICTIFQDLGNIVFHKMIVF